MSTGKKIFDKVLVCLKQVPNTQDVKIDPITRTLIREGVENILNPYDDYALEEALLLKRKYNIKVGILTMGPPQSEDILKYGLQRGADEAFLLSDVKLSGSDTLATSLAIVALIKKVDYKIIFCGQESIDSGTGHIGVGIAELLSIPQVNYVKKILGVINDRIKVLSKFDNGDALLDVRLPAVISFLKSNKKIPKKKNRETNLKKIKKYNLEDIGLNSDYIGLDGSATRVINLEIDDRFIEYIVVDSKLTASERIKFILDGGITVKNNRKIVKELSEVTIKEIVGLINDIV